MSSDRSDDRAALLTALDREIRQVSGLGVLFSQAVAERLGMNSTDLECLDIVVLREPVTAGQLAEATGLTTGAITGVIDRLERAGLARRERDPDDRRKVIVRSLPEVHRRIVPLYESLQRAMAELWSGYGERDLALIIDFAARSNRVMADEIAKLRATAEPTGRKAKRPQGPATSRRTRTVGPADR